MELEWEEVRKIISEGIYIGFDLMYINKLSGGLKVEGGGSKESGKVELLNLNYMFFEVLFVLSEREEGGDDDDEEVMVLLVVVKFVNIKLSDYRELYVWLSSYLEILMEKEMDGILVMVFDV